MKITCDAHIAMQGIVQKHTRRAAARQLSARSRAAGRNARLCLAGAVPAPPAPGGAGFRPAFEQRESLSRRGQRCGGTGGRGGDRLFRLWMRRGSRSLKEKGSGWGQNPKWQVDGGTDWWYTAHGSKADVPQKGHMEWKRSKTRPSLRKTTAPKK